MSQEKKKRTRAEIEEEIRSKFRPAGVEQQTQPEFVTNEFGSFIIGDKEEPEE